jgi:arylsulfatase A-like enzyme
MENDSGFLDRTDEQADRLIEVVEKAGELDNTLVLYIVGDNGASGEGGSRARPPSPFRGRIEQVRIEVK